MAEAIENEDSPNLTDDDDDSGQDTSVADTDTIETLKEKLDKQTQQNQKLFERAKKAEGFEKQPDGSWVKVQKKPEVEKPKPAPVAQTETGLTPKDALVLMDNKITNEEDIDAVQEYAQFKKISISEALKSSIVKTMLADKAELRKTAQATSTGPARRGTTKPTTEAILENASRGKLPDDPAELADARIDSKKKK